MVKLDGRLNLPYLKKLGMVKEDIKDLTLTAVWRYFKVPTYIATDATKPVWDNIRVTRVGPNRNRTTIEIEMEDLMINQNGRQIEAPGSTGSKYDLRVVPAVYSATFVPSRGDASYNDMNFRLMGGVSPSKSPDLGLHASLTCSTPEDAIPAGCYRGYKALEAIIIPN